MHPKLSHKRWSLLHFFLHTRHKFFPGHSYVCSSSVLGPWSLPWKACIWFASVAYVPPSSSLPCLFPNLGLGVPLPSYEPHWFVLGKTYPWSMCWALGWGWQNGGMKTVPSFLPIRKPKRRTQNTSLGIENRVSKVTYHEFGYLRELVLIKREILLIKGNQAPMMYVL